MDHQLLFYRKEIDTLDFQLLDTLALQNQEKEIDTLLKKRTALVEKIAMYKKNYNLTPFDTEREVLLLKTRIAYGKKIGLSEEKVRDFFCTVLKSSHIIIESLFQDKEI